MAKIHYLAFCPTGNRLDVTARETARRLAEVARLLMDAEDEQPTHIPRYRTELDKLKAQRTREDGSLMQHVAHCTSGCIRAKGGALAFAADSQGGAFDRSPAHQKPTLPKPGQLAELIQSGQTVTDLATTYDRDPSTIRTHLVRAGYSSTTGLPRVRQQRQTSPLPLDQDTREWVIDAACAQTDPELFFPDKGGSTREAKRICASCPVQAECLDDALANNERFGIWGGVAERTRRALAQPTNTEQQESA